MHDLLLYWSPLSLSLSLSLSLLSLSLSSGHHERTALHSIVHLPVKSFNEGVVAIATHCWQWLIAACPDLEFKVREGMGEREREGGREREGRGGRGREGEGGGGRERGDSGEGGREGTQRREGEESRREDGKGRVHAHVYYNDCLSYSIVYEGVLSCLAVDYYCSERNVFFSYKETLIK